MTEDIEQLADEIYDMTHYPCEMCGLQIGDIDNEIENCPRCRYPIIESLMDHLRALELK